MPDTLALKSLELCQLLRSKGFTDRGGVSTAGLRLVKALAKKHGLRDWPDTRDERDYDELLAVVERFNPAP